MKSFAVWIKEKKNKTKGAGSAWEEDRPTPVPHVYLLHKQMYEKRKMEIKKFLQKSTDCFVFMSTMSLCIVWNLEHTLPPHVYLNECCWTTCKLLSDTQQGVLHVRCRGVELLAPRLWRAASGRPLQNVPACKVSLVEQVNLMLCTCVALTDRWIIILIPHTSNGILFVFIVGY